MNEWLDDFKMAAGFLTRLPVPHPDGAGPANFARAYRLFPVVGGLIFSQTLTLYVTPVFYLYMEKLRKKPKDEMPPGNALDELTKYEEAEAQPV